MRKITDHVANPINDRIQIAVIDDPGAGGACHVYEITSTAEAGKPPGSEMEPVVIRFQNWPIAEKGINGITQEVLLAIVIDRLRSFQEGPFRLPGERRRARRRRGGARRPAQSGARYAQ